MTEHYTSEATDISKLPPEVFGKLPMNINTLSPKKRERLIEGAVWRAEKDKSQWPPEHIFISCLGIIYLGALMAEMFFGFGNGGSGFSPFGYGTGF